LGKKQKQNKIEAAIKGKCPKCYDGKLITIELPGRSLRKCDNCNYREKAVLHRD